MKDVKTELIFSPIPKDHAKIIWPNVAKVLKRSVATAEGKYEVDDLLDLILKDELVLWVVLDTTDDEVVAAITTRLIEYPQGNAMAMDWIGGTRMKEWLPIAHKTLENYALIGLRTLLLAKREITEEEYEKCHQEAFLQYN